jgi:hypothetical protein
VVEVKVAPTAIESWVKNVADPTQAPYARIDGPRVWIEFSVHAVTPMVLLIALALGAIVARAAGFAPCGVVACGRCNGCTFSWSRSSCSSWAPVTSRRRSIR